MGGTVAPGLPATKLSAADAKVADSVEAILREQGPLRADEVRMMFPPGEDGTRPRGTRIRRVLRSDDRFELVGDPGAYDRRPGSKLWRLAA